MYIEKCDKIPSKASGMLPTSDWQLAQTHEAGAPPSCVSMDEFPIKIMVFQNQQNLSINTNTHFPSISLSSHNNQTLTHTHTDKTIKHVEYLKL